MLFFLHSVVKMNNSLVFFLFGYFAIKVTVFEWHMISGYAFLHVHEVGQVILLFVKIDVHGPITCNS